VPANLGKDAGKDTKKGELNELAFVKLTVARGFIRPAC